MCEEFISIKEYVIKFGLGGLFHTTELLWSTK